MQHNHISHVHQQISEHNHQLRTVRDLRWRFIISLVLTIPVVILSPIIQGVLGVSEFLPFPFNDYLLWFFSTAVFAYGSWPFLLGALEELGSFKPGIMTLVATAITAVYGYSTAVVFGFAGMHFFWELVTLIDILLFGHWIEMKSVASAQKAFFALARLTPKIAHLFAKDGTIADVPADSLIQGNRIIVRPGEHIPADGLVIDGNSFVNETMLTGGMKPSEKQVGNAVIGGTHNGEGSLIVKVTRSAEESYLYGIIALINRARASKSRLQNAVNLAAVILTIVVLSASVATLMWWLEESHQHLAFAIERAITVLVIACPHALLLAMPLVVVVSSTLAAKHGLIIQNRAAFEKARSIKALVFDTTNTITEAKLAIEHLKRRRIRPIMLTSDNREAARTLASELGVSEYFAEVLPHQKAEIIKRLQTRGTVVAMVGDGINDAAALAQADIGIAIGAGVDIAQQTADIILVRSNLNDAVAVLELSRATHKKMAQNLCWALGYNVVAIPLAAGILYQQGILLNPAVGAVLMALSIVMVAINSRMLTLVSQP